MPITYAFALGRSVYAADGIFIRAFADAWLAIAYAARVNAGEIQVERRAA